MLLTALLFALAQQATPPVDTAAPTVQPGSGGQPLASPPPLAPGQVETVTQVRYTVNTDGRVEGCSVLKSDATPEVQRTICATLTERARFKPRLEGGLPVATVEEKTVRFRTGAGAAVTAGPPAGAGPRAPLPPGR